VLHLHLSGGEPASRGDLEALVAGARAAGLYVNLITSGIGLTERRVAALDAAGLDHVQLSLQRQAARKLLVAEWVAARGLPLTVNAVVHRQNLDRLEETIALAVRLGARRLEVATVQFHGWAARNRVALMPTRDQAARARETVLAARERLKGVLVIDYVPADHHARYPKACMGGWGSTGINVAPDGTVLPCHAAQTIPGLRFERLGDRPLAAIWADGPAFRAFRGEDWMQEPCRSCERRAIDFGGCRCQAFALAGDAAATDPVCAKSPAHAALAAAAEAEAAAAPEPFVYRRLAAARP
jgi:pyrroloquinoline quinone biosynthesis protein E